MLHITHIIARHLVGKDARSRRWRRQNRRPLMRCSRLAVGKHRAHQLLRTSLVGKLSAHLL